jgi:hypothetical protein
MGSDPFTEIAVLYVQEVPKYTLLPLSLGNSAEVDMDEQIAVYRSMTASIVSGVGQVLPSGLSIFHSQHNPDRCTK